MPKKHLSFGIRCGCDLHFFKLYLNAPHSVLNETPNYTTLTGSVKALQLHITLIWDTF